MGAPYILLPRSAPVVAPLAPPPPAFRANYPGWPTTRSIDFSQTPLQAPPANDQIDNLIGSTGWREIFFAQNWSQFSDVTAPKSPPTTWRGKFAAGQYFEAQTVPSVGPFTVTVTYAANFGSDFACYDNNGNPMTKVASAPAFGQYAVSAGVYTFNSAQGGLAVYPAYLFANATGVPVGSTALGTLSGHGIGNVFSVDLNGASRAYASLLCYFEMPSTAYLHTISNKFITLDTNVPTSIIPSGTGTTLVQLFEGNANWLECDDEAGGNFSILPGQTPGRINNTPVSINAWHEIEVLIDIPNTTWKTWLDGQPMTSTTSAPFVSTSFQNFKVTAFRGGGGETLSSDVFWRFDDFFLAW